MQPVNSRLIDVFPVRFDRIADAIFTAATSADRCQGETSPENMLGPKTLRNRKKENKNMVDLRNLPFTRCFWNRSLQECAVPHSQSTSSDSRSSCPTGGCPYLCSHRTCSSQNAALLLLLFHFICAVPKNGCSQNLRGASWSGCWMRQENISTVPWSIFFWKWVPNQDQKWVPYFNVHPSW